METFFREDNGVAFSHMFNSLKSIFAENMGTA